MNCTMAGDLPPTTNDETFQEPANNFNGRQRLEISPGSTKYWIPEVQQEKIPRVGMHFATLEIGINFYKEYGAISGFDIRRSTTKKFKNEVIRLHYVLCNREGFKNTKNNIPIEPTDEAENSPPHGSRKRTSNRVGCNARCILEYTSAGAYKIRSFEERHTHPVAIDTFRQFLKVNRNLNFGHQQFIMNCTKANIGSSKQHELFREMVGGFSHVGALKIDFKNFKRDLKAYICGADAQLVIDNLFKQKEINQGMAFEYAVDEDEQLTRLFWADQKSIRNYAIFGDAVSFDATYNTNRYKMVFAPFTGVDNHRRCVTFGAGLILKEDEESYTWLFKKFLEAVGREPYYIVTDQDPAMKNAIQSVFKTSIHRLCMWHIMEKVNVKVGHTLFKDNNFRNRLNSIVWDTNISPTQFETEWNDIMSDFGLTSHAWFIHMYELRKNWIPAYFKDVPMSGLLKTTSRSESTNSWFGNFTNPGSNLVEFFMHFQSAIDSQRHTTDKLDHTCQTAFPECKTRLAIEKHASSVYTHTVFADVSTEIEASFYDCTITEITDDATKCSYKIKDKTDTMFDVVKYKMETLVKCSCKQFEQMGLLCCHAFVILKDYPEIPMELLARRWMKSASITTHTKSGQIYQFAGGDEAALTLNNLWSNFHSCIGLAQGNIDKLSNLSRLVSDEKVKLLKDQPYTPSMGSKQSVMETYCGSTSHLDISVLPPKQAKNKGSGSNVRSRILSQREKAIKASTKLKRRCGTCGEIGTHNSRTCPKRNTTP